MKLTGTYNPTTDIQPVDQFSYTDLTKAHASGVVLANDTAKEPNYNGIEDPRSILPRATDVFEQMQTAKSVVGYQAPSKEEKPPQNA